jgi:hypothetical protein
LAPKPVFARSLRILRLGRIDAAPGRSVAQGGSFDQIAGSISSLFDFDSERGGRDEERRLILDASTGQPVHW